MKVIYLSCWKPVLVRGDEPELLFEGFVGRKKTCSKRFKICRTEAVALRVTKNELALKNADTCMLVGELHDPENVVPNSVKSVFKTGVPSNWLYVLKKWAKDSKRTLVGKSLREFAVKPEPMASIVSSGALKISSRGRIIIPPLKYWKGERLQLKNGDFLYTVGPTYKSCLNTSLNTSLPTIVHKIRKCSRSEESRQKEKPDIGEKIVHPSNHISCAQSEPQQKKLGNITSLESEFSKHKTLIKVVTPKNLLKETKKIRINKQFSQQIHSKNVELFKIHTRNGQICKRRSSHGFVNDCSDRLKTETKSLPDSKLKVHKCTDDNAGLRGSGNGEVHTFRLTRHSYHTKRQSEPKICTEAPQNNVNFIDDSDVLKNKEKKGVSNIPVARKKCENKTQSEQSLCESRRKFLRSSVSESTSIMSLRSRMFPKSVNHESRFAIGRQSRKRKLSPLEKLGKTPPRKRLCPNFPTSRTKKKFEDEKKSVSSDHEEFFQKKSKQLDILESKPLCHKTGRKLDNLKTKVVNVKEQPIKQHYLRQNHRKNVNLLRVDGIEVKYKDCEHSCKLFKNSCSISLKTEANKSSDTTKQVHKFKDSDGDFISKQNKVTSTIHTAKETVGSNKDSTYQTRTVTVKKTSTSLSNKVSKKKSVVPQCGQSLSTSSSTGTGRRRNCQSAEEMVRKSSVKDVKNDKCLDAPTISSAQTHADLQLSKISCKLAQSTKLSQRTVKSQTEVNRVEKWLSESNKNKISKNSKSNFTTQDVATTVVSTRTVNLRNMATTKSNFNKQPKGKSLSVKQKSLEKCVGVSIRRTRTIITEGNGSSRRKGRNNNVHDKKCKENIKEKALKNKLPVVKKNNRSKLLDPPQKERKPVFKEVKNCVEKLGANESFLLLDEICSSEMAPPKTLKQRKKFQSKINVVSKNQHSCPDLFADPSYNQVFGDEGSCVLQDWASDSLTNARLTDQISVGSATPPTAYMKDFISDDRLSIRSRSPCDRTIHDTDEVLRYVHRQLKNKNCLRKNRNQDAKELKDVKQVQDKTTVEVQTMCAALAEGRPLPSNVFDLQYRHRTVSDCSDISDISDVFDDTFFKKMT